MDNERQLSIRLRMRHFAFFLLDNKSHSFTAVNQISWAPVIFMQGGFIVFGGFQGEQNVSDKDSKVIARFDEASSKWSKVRLLVFSMFFNHFKVRKHGASPPYT